MQQVRIKRLPSKALGGTKTGQQTADGALSIQPTAMGGADIDQYIGEKAVDVKKTLQPEPREKSNVEVEKGEVVAGDLNGDGMIETYIAGGKRHSQGGTPLNLPDDTFIFSDTKSMKIKNPDILKKFGKTSGSYTPASLAKQYDINKYRKILQDPESDAVDRKTAELMIRNYTMKLGALSVAQEGKKGFPQGVPLIAQPFMEANKITEEQVKPTYKPKFASQEPETTEEAAEPQEEVGLDESMPTEMPNGEQIAMSPEMMGEAPMAAYGMNMGGYSFPYAPEYEEGGLVKAQEGTSVKPPYKMNEAYTPTGVVRLNTFRKKYGLPQLKGSVTKADIQKAAGELQAKIAESNPDLLVDYMTTKSHQPNRELLKIIPAGYPKTTAGVKKALADGKLSVDKIRTAYKDNEWWYRALDTQVKELSKEEYEKKMKDPAAIKQGDILFFNEDPANPEMYTQYVMKEAAKADDKIDVPKTTDEDDTDVDETDYDYDYSQPPMETKAQWTTPDVVNFAGALGDRASLRKQYPWSPMVDFEESRPRYLDVTRPAAALAEQANIAQQNLAQFTGSPQLSSARTMGMQGQLAKNVVDLMSNYNNQNVQIANQFSQANSNIRNQERLKNQEIATRLYDQTNMMNQQYDNSKRAANANVRQAFATGWKNASDLSMVNSMSEQYDIDPVTGNVIFQGGKDFTPERSQTFNDMLNGYIEAGFDPKDAITAAKEAMKGYTPTTGIDYQALMQNMQYGKDGGGIYVMGANVFPFMFY
jgi:hypothetical protein